MLAPKDSRSLVGQVQIAVDGRNGVPLRVQVFARGAGSPAFQVGYTSISFVTPAPANFSFTPPPGAKVQGEPGQIRSLPVRAASPAASAPIGKDWLSVAVLPSSGLASRRAAGAGLVPGSGGRR